MVQKLTHKDQLAIQNSPSSEEVPVLDSTCGALKKGKDAMEKCLKECQRES